ncbi:MAG: hypothetical protein NC331_16840 [Lachnospiraceae bacterium]|nr:hypothetical protein [Lachnospiraceae bacterium]MCM1241015.1 hypothetical protein [Lachnospiraceae bacterium]
MRETRTGGRGRGRDLPHPKPVNKIELSTEHKRLRLVLAAVFLVVGALLIAYSVANLSSKDVGWSEIKADSSELNCGGDFVFLYCLGEGDISATAEYKALTACYSDAAEYAFRIFTNDVAYENVHNMYDISRHPNEEMEIDEVLYRAFSLIRESGDRSLYLAPVYEQYNGLFHCTEEYQAAEYDPYENQDVADYYAAVAGFANDAGMIDLELLGENRIRLRVAEEYLAFAAENEIESFIDFYWMKNAFIIDYLAEEMLAAGYFRGCISSVDGFTRNLDGSGELYAYTFYDRVDATVYPAANVQYSGPSGIVYLHDYPLDGAQQYYYVYSSGEIRTPYLDARDGFCKSACSGLACYGREAGCSAILLRIIPVYIADTFEKETLEKMAGEGIFSIYSENGRVCYNDAGLTVTEL